MLLFSAVTTVAGGNVSHAFAISFTSRVPFTGSSVLLKDSAGLAWHLQHLANHNQLLSQLGRSFSPWSQL